MGRVRSRILLNVGFLSGLRPEDIRDIGFGLTYMSEHRGEQNLFGNPQSHYSSIVREHMDKYWNEMVESGAANLHDLASFRGPDNLVVIETVLCIRYQQNNGVGEMVVVDVIVLLFGLGKCGIDTNHLQDLEVLCFRERDRFIKICNTIGCLSLLFGFLSIAGVILGRMILDCDGSERHKYAREDSEEICKSFTHNTVILIMFYSYNKLDQMIIYCLLITLTMQY